MTYVENKDSYIRRALSDLTDVFVDLHITETIGEYERTSLSKKLDLIRTHLESALKVQ